MIFHRVRSDHRLFSVPSAPLWYILLFIRHRFLDRFDDRVGVGQVVLLGLEVGEVDVVAGDAFDRGDEELEGLFVEAGDDFRGYAAGTRAFVDDHAAARLGDRLDQRFGVHGFDREQVDDLDIHIVNIDKVFDLLSLKILVILHFLNPNDFP